MGSLVISAGDCGGGYDSIYPPDGRAASPRTCRTGHHPRTRRPDARDRGRVASRGRDQESHSLTVITSSHALRAAIITAIVHATPRSSGPFTNSPILARFEVNITSGITANDSCSDNTTW